MSRNLAGARSRSPVRGKAGEPTCRFDREKPGSCRFGETCRFTHTNNIGGPTFGSRFPRSSGDSSVCFDFQNRGSCSRGDSCQFQHTNPRLSPCNDFFGGYCRRGDSCRFSHQPEGAGGFPPVGDYRDYGGFVDYIQSTPLGGYDGFPPPRGLQTIIPSRGPPMELPIRAPSRAFSIRAPLMMGPRYEPAPIHDQGSEHQSSSVCFDFQNHGKCSRGEDCKFTHTDPGKSACYDYKAGRCRRGDACRFSHDGSGRTISLEEPCYDFLSGTCRFGLRCKYTHEMPAARRTSGLPAAFNDYDLMHSANYESYVVMPDIRANLPNEYSRRPSGPHMRTLQSMYPSYPARY